MVVIGYDRYNVIVKGFSGKKISPGMAASILGVIWGYSVLICCAPFAGWGDYMAEGLLLTCTYDFLSPGVNERTFILFAYIFNFFFPMFLIGTFYYSIVKARRIRKREKGYLRMFMQRTSFYFLCLLLPFALCMLNILL